jgi:hypothetical protein
VRKWGIFAVALAIAAAGPAVAPASGGSKSGVTKIPLPQPDHAQVSLLTVKVSVPKGKRLRSLKLAAKNAAQLGSPQVNTQVVTAVSKKSSNRRTATFNVYVFIHRFQAVSSASDQRATAAQFLGVFASIAYREPDTVGKPELVHIIRDLSCSELRGARFFGDTFEDSLTNVVPDFDTPTEEQIDNTVWTKCQDVQPRPEAPDPGAG